jgi:hypothetical protein
MPRSRLACVVVLLAAGAASRTAHAAFHRFSYSSGAECNPSAPQMDLVSYSELGIKVLDQTPTPLRAVSLVCPVPWSQDNFLPWAQPAQAITIQLYMQRDPLPPAAAATTSTTPPPDPGCMALVLGPAGSMYYIPTTDIQGQGTENPIYTLSSTEEMPLGTVFGTTIYCDSVTSGTSFLGYSVDVCFSTDPSSC